MNFKNLFLITLFFIFLNSCGEGVVEIENVSYKPKLSIDGFLIPGQKVDKIHVFRNFKLDQDLNEINFFPENTAVTITDEQNQQTYDLSYHIPDDLTNPDSVDLEDFYWQYNGNDLSIEYANSYTLEVNAQIDGVQLWTRSTTTVPQQGFEINSLNFTSLEFAQKKENGDFEFFEVSLQRSPGVTYYMATIKPLDITFESLIVDHLAGEIDEKMYEENFEEYTFDRNSIQNTPSDSGTLGQSVLRMFWFDFYFYSDYEIIVYAVDENYRKYLQTFQNVQEFDGNFHEAAFSFEGDGIGVFGSIIPDTTYITVTREIQ